MSNAIQAAVKSATNVPVLVHPHPFESSAKLMAAIEGQSIAALVKKAGFPPVYNQYLRVWINDREIARADWRTTFVADGENVYIRVVPQKSGKDIFRAIAMVVITVVAYAVAGPIGGALAGKLGLGAMGTQIVTGLVAAGIATIGYLALNALVPPPGLKNNQQDEKYRLTGSSNQFAPYGNIPRVFGKRRIFPLLAARPYSEIQGDDEYLRMALVVGWGPLEITNIKIGETPITAFDGVQWEVREGWSNDTPLTLFTRTVTEDGFSIVLEPFGSTNYYPGGYGYVGEYYRYNPDTGTYGTVSTSNTNGWAQRTTSTNTVEFSVDISFPQGLFRFDNKGKQKSATVEVEVQYRLVGATTWINAVWQNSFETGFGTAGKITVTAEDTSAIRRSGLVKVATAGQYEVRIRRTTQNGGDKYVDLTWWSALRSVKADYPVNQTGVALIALRIKASGQLNGVPQTINCEAHSYLPVYNGSTWTYTKSSNPAWAFADLLRRRGTETLIADSRIDLTSIMNWATACDATAPNASEPRWTFNGVLEGGSVIDALKIVASNARALYTMRDGKHSVVRDIQQTVPVQHITPRNSFGYSGEKVFVDYPHALRVMFINKDNGYQQDERVVYADGYTAANATKFETLELVGCTSATQAFREARYHMAVARLRPETHVVQMDIEALRCTLGDLVMFSHDAIGIGIAASRVKAVTTSGSNVTTVTLEDDVYFETGKTYSLRTRKSDGTTRLQALTNPGTGFASTVTITTPVAVANSPAVGDLVMFGETATVTAPMIVRKIEPSEDFVVTLTLVDAQDGVYTADTGTIPAFNSYLTKAADAGKGKVPPVYISTVRSDDSVTIVNIDGSLNNRIFVQVQQPVGTYEQRCAYFELQYRVSGGPTWSSVQMSREQPFAYIDRVEVGKAYQLRSRGVAESGDASEWSSIVTHTVIGKTNFADVITGFTASGVNGGIRLSWVNPTADDFWEVEVYENTTNNSATATLIGETNSNYYLRTGLSADDGARFYWLKAVDNSGNKSAFVGPASATALTKALVMVMTNEAISLVSDAAGTVTSFADAIGQITVYDGDTDVTASATLSATQTNVTGTVNTATGNPVAGQPKGYYRVTAMSANQGTLTLTATYAGTTISKVFSVSKAITGSNGVDAVTLRTTNPSIILDAFANGTTSFTSATGQLTVFAGTTDVTASATLSASSATLTATVNTAAGTPVAGQPKGFYRITAMPNADLSGLLTLTAVYNGQTYTTPVSVAKAVRGYEIVSTLPTTNLFAGRMVFLSTDNKLYRHNGTAWTTAVPTSDLSGTITTTQIADAALTTAKFATGIEPVTVVSSVPGTKSTNSIFNTADGKLYRWNGSAYVATVPTVDLSGTIEAAQIANGAVTTAKFANGIEPVEIVSTLPTTGNFKGRIAFLTTDNKLYRHNGTSWTAAVPTADLSGTIAASQIANGAVTLDKFASGLEPVEIVSSLPTTGLFAGRIAYLTTDGKLYRSNGSSWTAAIPAVDVTGQLSDSQLAAIAATKITGTITGTQITDGAISTAKLAVGAVTADNITSGSITTGKLAAGAVTATTIAAGAITTAKLAAGAVTATEIASDAITAAKIAAGAVTAGRIAANAVTANEIAAGSITTAKIAAGAVTASTIAADTITSSKMAANSILADKIAAGAVTAGKIAAGAVTANEIAAGAVTTAKLAAGAVTANEIAANTITGGNIAANTITGGNIAADTITAGNIAAGAVTASEIAARAVTVDKLTVADFTTLCDNGDFEAGDIGWTKDGAFQIINSSAYRGGWCAYAFIGANSGSFACRNNLFIDVQPGEEYMAEAWIKRSNVSAASGYVRIRGVNASGAEVWTADGNTTSSTAYARSVVYATVPANVAKINVELVYTAGSSNSFVYFDNVKMLRRAAGELIVDGAITASKIAANAITANKILVKGTGDSIIPDSNTQDETSWTSGGPFTLGTESTSPNGRAITINSVGQATLSNPMVPIDPNKNYLARIWCRQVSGTPGSYLLCAFYNSGGFLRVGSDHPTGWPGVGTYHYWGRVNQLIPSTWTEYTISFGPNETAKIPSGSAFVQIGMLANYTASGTSQFARLSIVEKSTGEVIVDGAITASKIASNAVTADKIDAGAITAGKIATNAVSAANIAAGAITASKLDTGQLITTSAQIADGIITNAKIGDLAVNTIQIAGSAITVPQTYANGDLFVNTAINMTGGGTSYTYNFVGSGNGDYSWLFDPYLGYNQYYYVGPGNGSYTQTITQTTPTFTGELTALETPQINIGIDSSAAMQIVFYATLDGSYANDAGQHIFMMVDKYNGSGYLLVGSAVIGTRTASGNTYAGIPIVMSHVVTGIQNARVKIVTGTRRVDGTPGTGSNSSYMRKPTLAVLGVKR